MQWMNRLGIILTFVSFWFAAPELIGERRLRAWEVIFARGLQGILRFIANTLLVISFFGSVLLVPWLLGIPLTSLTEMNFFVDAIGFVGFILAWSFALWIADLLEIAFSKPFSRALHWLADDAQIRRRSLLYGAWLFVIGSILQLWSTFE